MSITYDTYVIHYTPLKERKQSIITQLSRFNIVPTFIELYDKEDLTPELLKKFNTTKLKMAEISVMCKQVHAWEHMSGEYALILEDDVILDDNFKEKLDAYLSQLPPDFDALFIGNGANLHIPHDIVKASPGNVFLRTHDATHWGGMGATRCLDSYIIKKSTANAISSRFKSINTIIHTPIDWLANILLKVVNARVYWAEPTIVRQGSEVGLFKSAIR